MKNFKQIFLSLLLVGFLFFPFISWGQESPSTVSIGNNQQMNAFQQSSGLATPHGAEHIVANVIRVVLSFLGILFVILIIVSGFRWMTAGGNEDIVHQAQSRIKNAVIGLLIVVMAYGITNFVFKNLPGGVNDNTSVD